MTKKVSVPLIILLAILTLIFLIFKPYYDFLVKTIKISPIKTLIESNSIKKVDDQVNILILGIPGGQHDGPNLSDSIIVVNYNYTKNRIITISIPRDIWSDTLRDRINSAYAYGEDKMPGGGLKLAKAEVAAIIGMPIQYSAVINFAQFDDLVDYLGGVDVVVETAFVDHDFPIEGRENDLCHGDPEYRCRYETISFTKGMRHMDGKTALKFVRSRHAEGNEGTDFARGRRQQLVILAIKDNILKIVKSLDLARIKKLYQNIDKLVSRDITNQQVAILLKKIVLKKKLYQKSFYLSHEAFDVPDYRLYDGKYVLVPHGGGDFTPIHEYVSCLLKSEDEKKCLAAIQ